VGGVILAALYDGPGFGLFEGLLCCMVVAAGGFRGERSFSAVIRGLAAAFGVGV